ncbi:glycerophosphodiester phosphodiesterase family protein [Neisseriaceae bacterium TC5R-5]|nr:glycerophosphodiester phosphodiesterase family protein [Neisseriaceae bacterium TC5R-5]
MKKQLILALSLVLFGLSACGDSGGGSTGISSTNLNRFGPNQPALVIAHRGASGYLPEHTLAGYELAIKMGADYIEPDLQLTKDNQLVAMHDDTLNRTTNVAELFEPRNGGYKVADFTLAEIQTLQVKPVGTAKSSYPDFTPSMANPFHIPTFQEVITFAQQQSKLNNRVVGIYPEAKQADPVMEDGILQALKSNAYNGSSKVFIQSFSDETLRSMRKKELTQNNKMPQIMLGAAVIDSNGKAGLGLMVGSTPTVLTLQDVASFAEGVGLSIGSKDYPVTKAFIDQAHAAGLQVHGWTFNKIDPTEAATQYQTYLEMGMDGMFSNYPDLAYKARQAFKPLR